MYVCMYMSAQSHWKHHYVTFMYECMYVCNESNCVSYAHTHIHTLRKEIQRTAMHKYMYVLNVLYKLYVYMYVCMYV